MSGQPAYTDAEFQAAAKSLAESRWRGFVAAQRREPVTEPNERYARAVLDAVAPAIVARAKAEALREAADRAIAETVCCDEYEQRKAGAPRPKYPHHICYWGAAHAEALRARADEIDAGREVLTDAEIGRLDDEGDVQ